MTGVWTGWHDVDVTTAGADRSQRDRRTRPRRRSVPAQREELLDGGREPGIRLGPLSAPGRISVIPPRRVLLFDISAPLRAHRDSWSPRVDLYFSDPVGRRWLRDAAGNLRDVTGESSTWERHEPVDERQLGARRR